MVNNKAASIFVLVASIVALSIAYIFQFIGYTPCKLCLYDRIPYFILIALASISICYNRWYIIVMIILVMIAEILLAGFHVGVEHHIFSFKTACSNPANLAENVEQFKQLLETAPTVPCDKPTLFFLGLSMASWNFICSILLLLIYSLLLYANYQKKVR